MDKVFIAIDPDVCVGVGKCEELEPNAVDLGDNSVSSPRPGIALTRERAELPERRHLDRRRRAE